jgi:DNA-binding MarR family transcriptional regulator
MQATTSLCTPASDRLVELAGQALTTLNGRRLGVWEHLGLSVRQIRFLYMVECHRDTPRVTELAEEMGVNPAIITGLTDRLMDLGLVVRKVDTQDRRVKHVELTQLGRNALAGGAAEASVIRNTLSQLDSAAAAALVHALEALDESALARA